MSYVVDGYDVKDLTLRWHDVDPVEFSQKELSLPQFELTKTSTKKCDMVTKTGNFDCLEAVFHLKRQFGFYVLQTYIPSILIVILSWISFWVNKEAVPARITLGVTTVLTMTTQLSTATKSTMRVSYPKALDVWYTFCMILVFLALIEYAFVNALARKGKRRRRLTDDDMELQELHITKPSATTLEDLHMEEAHVMVARDMYHHRPSTCSTNGPINLRYRIFKAIHSGWIKLHQTSNRLTADGLDKACRIVFPVSFGVFNFLYWVIYTQPIVYKLDE